MLYSNFFFFLQSKFKLGSLNYSIYLAKEKCKEFTFIITGNITICEWCINSEKFHPLLIHKF